MNRCAGASAWAAVFVVSAFGGCDSSAPDFQNAGTTGADRSSAAAGPGSGGTRSESAIFSEITQQSELSFRHDPGPTGRFFFPEIIGPGGALFDYDADGDLDIYLINGGRHPLQLDPLKPEGPARKWSPALNRMFRRESDGRYTDVTEQSGLGDAGYGMGVAIGDVNNDGLADVYVTNYGPDRLFVNRGNGMFVDVTRQAGIDNPNWGASACFFDYDRDGQLDLFVTNYVHYDPSVDCHLARGESEEYCPPGRFRFTADRLFRNESPPVPAKPIEADDASAEIAAVKFRDVSVASGVAGAVGPGLGVLPADFNDDGWPDVFVANDQAANFLWTNQRNGTFREEALLYGCACDNEGAPQASMGIAWGDVNDDGRFDLILTHLAQERNAVYLADGLIGFRDAAVRCGIGSASLPWTGFGTALVDLNHDGDLDLLVVNGKVRRDKSSPGSASGSPAGSSLKFFHPYAERNQVLLNDGRGTFRESTATADSMTAVSEVSRGLAVGDVDGDGDLDALVTNTAGPARLYRNDAPKSGSWLLVRAVEPALGGRDSLGAVVTVFTAGRSWRRQIISGGSYLSVSDPRAHFGLGGARAVARIEVHWPDGSRETFLGGPVNRTLVLQHGDGESP